MRNIFAALTIVALTGSYWSPSLPQKTYTEERDQVFKMYRPDAGGTGWSVNYRGEQFLITNAHVCGDEGIMEAKNDHSDNYIDVLAKDMENDLCIMSPVRGYRGLDLAAELSEKNLHILGYPHLRPLTRRQGEIIGTESISIITKTWLLPEDECPAHSERKEIALYSIIEMAVCVQTYETKVTDIEVYPGNSGSPVINADGKVVGIIFASDQRVNQGYLIPVGKIKKLLDELIDDAQDEADEG